MLAPPSHKFTNDVEFSADLICFCHLRWNFVYQRPQHLMARFAKHTRVFFVEEPEFHQQAINELRISRCERSGVNVLTPLISEALRSNAAAIAAQLLDSALLQQGVEQPVFWIYTPMALDSLPQMVRPEVVVYDCMDELSLFRFAPKGLLEKEQQLLRSADLVFTGGVSLFEAKCNQHSHVYPFPSSVDVQHFAQARSLNGDAPDQGHLPRPRFGFAGVIDERMDLDLVRGIAELRPEWQLMMLGPIAKLAPDALPQAPNIHWLGMKPYDDLPSYMAGWDVALMPFALNDSTLFISPTKTPEYLAAGLPVVSTAIRDVVRPYGELGLVHIASTAKEFVAEAESAMNRGMSMKWRERSDAFLATLSWDTTWREMAQLIAGVVEQKLEAPAQPVSLLEQTARV